MNFPLRRWLLLLLLVLGDRLDAQELRGPTVAPRSSPIKRLDDAQSKVLPPGEWARLDAAIDRALAFLASQQKPDGSFPTLERGQPGVTSLCLLAYMAHGYSPGEGRFGGQLDRATDYIVACQQESGLINKLGPEGPTITTNIDHLIGEPAAYSHAISSLTLSEMYGMGQPRRAAQLKRVIEKSLAVTLQMQRRPKDLLVDQGGWRYVTDDGPNDSDLSITGWQLMFLRSARNAGFNVPQQPIDNAIQYVRRTFDKNLGTFRYVIAPSRFSSRAMTGAGILALAHAGYHNSPEAKTAAEWMLKHSFAPYNDNNGLVSDRYHYSLFNACQGMYQMGGPYWKKFFPRVVATLLARQQPGGAWDAESFARDRPFGNCYTTALVVLALGAPNQFLPVFQR
ncbi:MAG TPA: prenyltransferase/squalene oxidase repeat-containing protein [Lacipirellulaceae bacterium]|nr:prenyltransferase/squalene oxidase repeat-containing protein [Lacipirellulaceae bacterium]